MKQYAVEVIEKYQHGKYGKEFYFGMYLPGFNKKDAEEVGMETLSDMTFREINERCIKQGELTHPWQVFTQHEFGEDKPIGREIAEMYFKCKAYIE